MDAPTPKPDGATSEWFTPWRFGIILVMLLFAAFPKVMLGLEAFYYRDFGVLGYPFVFHHHEAFWRGELPLWNPLSNCGTPFLAQWGTMTLYPFSLLYLIFPLPWSLSYFCLGHFMLGGFGMYALAQRWAGNRLGSSVAGVAYIFNGVTFSCLLWPNYTVALGWMPWVVLWVERSWREGGRWLVVAALAAALQLLSGVPEIVLMTWLLLGCLWLEAMLRGAESRAALAKRLGLVVVLVAGLAAVQLLPFFELLSHSQRDRTFTSSKWPMPGTGWANLLVPLFHCFESFSGSFFQYGQEFLTSYYPGGAILVLAAWAAWRVRERRVWILAGLVVFGYVMALGENSFLFVGARKVFPLLKIVRYSVKFVLLPAFVLPLLAAFALSQWEKLESPLVRGWRWLVGMGLAALAMMAAILWFARQYPFAYDQWDATWKNAAMRAFFLALILGLVVLLSRFKRGRAPQAMGLGILVCLGADLLTHTRPQNPSIPTEAFTPGLWREFNPMPPPKFGESRAMITPEAEAVLLISKERDGLKDFVAKRRALWSNLNVLDEAPKVNGSSTLQIKEQMQVQSLLYGKTSSPAPGLVDFLGVSLLTSRESAIEWTTRTNFGALATTGQGAVFAGPEQTLSALANDLFDPRQTVYLPPEAGASVTVTNRTSARIVASSFSAHRLALEVEAEEPSLVVVAQSFYPAWQARVDGEPARLWPANHAFQALQVPRGRHRVRLDYVDAKLRLGAVISGLALLACFILWRRSPRP